MLAELGPVGLALVLAPVRIPARPRGASTATGRSSRSLRRFSSPTSRAQAIDWDWEFPILTLVALGCAGVIVAEGVDRPSGTSRRGAHRAPRSLRWPSCPIVAVTTVGNRAQAASAEAFADRDFERAAAEAKTAERLAPWSVEPVVLLGRAQAGAGDRGSARETFRRAASVEPEYWRVWLELAAVSRGAST